MVDNENQDVEQGPAEPPGLQDGLYINGRLALGRADSEGRVFELTTLPDNPPLVFSHATVALTPGDIVVTPPELAEAVVQAFAVPKAVWDVRLTEDQMDRFTRLIFGNSAIPSWWWRPRKPLTRKQQFRRDRREARQRAKMRRAVEAAAEHIIDQLESEILWGD